MHEYTKHQRRTNLIIFISTSATLNNLRDLSSLRWCNSIGCHLVLIDAQIDMLKMPSSTVRTMRVQTLIVGVFNSSPPSAAYMRHWMMSALVQIMACRRIGDKPLSKPMMGFCQLDTSNKLQCNFEILIKIQNFSFTKMYLKISSAKWRPFMDVHVWIIQMSVLYIRDLYD